MFFAWLTTLGGGGLPKFLVGEELEQRSVPASFRWTTTQPGTLGASWDLAEFWRKETVVDGRSLGWFTTATVPGADDDVIFRPESSNARCFVSGNRTVKSVTFEAGYQGGLDLSPQNALTVTKTITMSSGSLRVGELRPGVPNPGNAKLVLPNGARFNWDGGTLDGIIVDIQAGARMNVTASYGEEGDQRHTTLSTVLDVKGLLSWAAAGVDNGKSTRAGSPPKSTITIREGGLFDIQNWSDSSTWGSPTGGGADNPNLLFILNEAGSLAKRGPETATLIGNYETYGETRVEKGRLAIYGAAEQKGGQFDLRNGSTVTVASTNTLAIRDGTIIGTGTINANLILGYAAQDNKPPTTPILSPGGGAQIGTITVNGNFHMFSGRLDIEVCGPDEGQYDLVVVSGYAAFTGGPAGARDVFTSVLPVHWYIPATTYIPFLKYSSLIGDFANRFVAPPWSYGNDATEYWVWTHDAIPANLAKVDGKVWLDNGAQPGVRVAGEGGIAGAGVNLLDAEGNQVAAAVADADGDFHFDNVPPGVWFVEFARPPGMRLAAANVGDPATDSDPDPANGRARVVVGLVAEVSNIDAGFYPDAAPIPVDDAYRGHKNVALTGNVLANDTDADGDALTAAVAAGPAHGTLLLNPDGSFTYTPDADYVGPDSFTYSVADGYDGTATGTANITVANTPAPVGAPDSYSTAAGPLAVDAAGGLLANDTNQNNGTLVAVLATGPAHGTLALNADGSFTYTPDEDFVGTDSFAYRPTDADGPGVRTTVSLSVTDHPPVAGNDSVTTNEDTSVTLAVLANDTDADSDTLAILGASDGLFGTTAVNANGTITYTPGADFNGTDTFVYVIDDGHGRLAYGVATVTVVPVNDAPTIDSTPVVVQKDTALDIDLRTLVTDPETGGDALAFAVSNAQHGTVQLLADGYTARFTPAAGYYGGASFTLSVTDTGDGASAAITTTTTISAPVNAPPMAGDVSTSYHAVAGQPLVVYPMCADPDGDALTRTVVEQPAHGTVAWDEAYGGWVYTNTDPTYTGTETFRYAVSDGRGGSATGTVTITLTNQPPQGTDVSVTWAGAGPVGIYPSYWDPDGDPLTVTSIVQPAVGSVAPDPSGYGVQYFPPPGFTGTVTFSYTVDDGHGGTLVVNVTVTITDGTGA